MSVNWANFLGITKYMIGTLVLNASYLLGKIIKALDAEKTMDWDDAGKRKEFIDNNMYCARNVDGVFKGPAGRVPNHLIR